MKITLLLFALPVAGCGVPKEFVRQETTTAFHDTVSVAAHVKMKCGGDAESDAHCVAARDKLAEVCQRLDELAVRGGAAGFDCITWKEKP